ncbi:hypothetical protein FOA52_004720 [Chlamydomonas sp. UWO 241]|nr:hypothetical protein FOA52_004720 [Chlamydomonas sp. UWO 241]
MSEFGDLAMPALAALAAIVIFIYALSMQNNSKRHIAASRMQALGDHGEREIKATVFVQENGQTVRRSTREHKSPSPLMSAPPSPKPKATPKPAPKKTPSKKTLVEKAVVAAEPATTPAKSTSKAAPKKSASKSDVKSKTPTALKRLQEVSPPRTRTRAAKA